MAHLIITTTNGDKLKLTGRRFSHYVGQYQHWFFLHHSISETGMSVTHYDSGKRVCTVPPMSICAARMDEKAAAKMELDKLIARVGEARVQAVLRSAAL